MRRKHGYVFLRVEPHLQGGWFFLCSCGFKKIGEFPYVIRQAQRHVKECRDPQEKEWIPADNHDKAFYSWFIGSKGYV